MQRPTLVKLHVAATAVASLTIISFMTATVGAEMSGDLVLVATVKRYILYALPILLVAMPTLARTGVKLGGHRPSKLVKTNLARMRAVGINGLVLVTLAIFLFIKSSHQAFDTAFWLMQGLEIVLGTVNLILIALNVVAGRVLSGKAKVVRP